MMRYGTKPLSCMSGRAGDVAAMLDWAWLGATAGALKDTHPLQRGVAEGREIGDVAEGTDGTTQTHSHTVSPPPARNVSVMAVSY